MKVSSLLCLVLGLGVAYSQNSWSNCPVPRSPKNGLSFIFQEGKEVSFRCLPGFNLIGNPVARCVNSVWDSHVPDCVSEKDENVSVKHEKDVSPVTEDSSSIRQLFSWEKSAGEEQSPEPEFIPGSRRLPLINGLWKPRITQEHKFQGTTNQTGRLAGSVNHTRNHYDQEMSIAEVRQRQQDEMQMNSVLRGSEHFPRGPNSRQNHRHRDAADRRRWKIAQARQSPNILYAGSRAASAYRGETDDENDLDASETLMGMFNWAEAPRPPSEIHLPQHLPSTVGTHRPDLSNDELIEIRQRQIAEALLNQMAANRPRGRNSDKAGLVEDARKKQYEELQLLRNKQKPVFENQGGVIAQSGFKREFGNFARRAHLTSNDYMVASGSEQQEKVALPKEGVSINLKPVLEEEVNVFKPTFYDEVERDLGDKSPARGDLGEIFDDTTEIPEMVEFTRQYSDVSREPETTYNMRLSNSYPGHNRASFSAEKAAQVEATIQRFLRPQPGIIVHTVHQPPPTVPTYHSNLVPRVTTRPTTTRPPYRPTTVRPPTRPPIWQPTRSPVMESNGDKAAQTEEALYQQYLQAEHLRRIMEYERERLEWERRRELERRYIMEEERQRQSNRRSALAEEDRTGSDNELVQKPEEEIYFSNSSEADLDYANRVAVLSSVDRDWLSQLSPDLQARYLEEILTSRRKESDESQHAQDFMRRHLENSIHNTTFPNVSTRTSASGHVTTIIQSQTAAPLNSTSSDRSQSKADMSCLQSRSGRRLFIRAPKVPFAFVYRYEKKKHTQHPFRPYLIAEYRCTRGYSMTPVESNSLFCRRMEWVGEKPRCVKGG